MANACRNGPAIAGLVCIVATLVTGAFAHVAARPVERRLSRPEFRQLPLGPALPAFEGCGSPHVSHSLEGSAPAILPDLVKRWTGEFSRLCHESVRLLPPFGPPLADRSPQLRRFIEGKIDFAFLTRDLSKADLEDYRRAHGGDPLVVSVALGSYRHFGFVDTLAIIVNRRNPVRHFSLAQIGSIFFKSAAGKEPPRYWSEIGGWLGQHPIHVVGSAAWTPVESARAGFLRRTLAENGVTTGNWRTDVPVAGNEADIPALVAADPDAVGFTGLGHLVPGDKPLAVSTNAAGIAVFPSYKNVALGNYPFSRTIDLLLSVPATGRLDPQLCAFVYFILSRAGQTIVRDQAVFLPLRRRQLFRSRARIAGYCSQ